MKKLLIGRKIGMSRFFDENGKVTPVTLIKTAEFKIVAIKKDEEKSLSTIYVKLAKDFSELTKENEKDSKKVIARSFTENIENEYKVGDKITLDSLDGEKTIDISTMSKGKGFAGTIKRHHFHRGPKTHGSHNVRQPGSIGAMYPQRVVKGKKMPGHLGAERVTIKKVKIVEINKAENFLVVKGSIPGIKNALVEIKG